MRNVVRPKKTRPTKKRRNEKKKTAKHNEHSPHNIEFNPGTGARQSCKSDNRRCSVSILKSVSMPCYLSRITLYPSCHVVFMLICLNYMTTSTLFGASTKLMARKSFEMIIDLGYTNDNFWVAVILACSLLN